tara:strand:- start:12782 stop:12883 length:102 start_codon:yes stop_codon:yes gene_type:complete
MKQRGKKNKYGKKKALRVSTTKSLGYNKDTPYK